jgi:hypothetical protein
MTQTGKLQQTVTLYVGFHAGFLRALFFDPKDGGDMFFTKRRLTFKELHGVMPQKPELLLVFTYVFCLSALGGFPLNTVMGDLATSADQNQFRILLYNMGIFY